MDGLRLVAKMLALAALASCAGSPGSQPQLSLVRSPARFLSHGTSPHVEELVDPFIGAAGRGSTMPGPCLPYASSYPSPDTLEARPSGYAAGKDFVGFSQLHLQGNGGNPSYGNFLVTPRLGLAIREADHASPKSDEVAKAYSYAVNLNRWGIRAEVVPAKHSALYRFTFPASDDAHINIDVARKIRGVVALDDGSVTFDPATGLITGGGRFSNNWSPPAYDLFFAARLDTPPIAFGTWVDTSVRPGAVTAGYRAPRPLEGKSIGTYARFRTTPGQSIKLKIAVSFTSVDRAKRWLDEEIPAWDMDWLRSDAAAEWHHALEVLTIPGANAEETRKFTTALWHSMVQPRDRTGDLPGFSPTAPLWDDQATLWDIWKSLFPLMAIVNPAAMRGNIASIIERHRVAKDGYASEAFIQGKEFKAGQGGNETDNVIADAFVKKIPGVDWEQAYAVLRHHADTVRTANYRAKGWMASDEVHNYSGRMHSGSGTLDFAYNDFNVAQVAAGLGKKADAERFLARSRSWLNIWDVSAESDGFRGFLRGRNLAGQFSGVPPTSGFNTEFYEGTSWELSFNVPHDLKTLIEKMGGRATFIKRLAHAYREGYMFISNETTFMSPWLFARAGRPYLTSFWVDQIRNEFSGLDLPGDDDGGAMSSLYVFATIGFFPIAGQDLYVVHGARVPMVVLRQENGKTFTVRTDGAGGPNIYVQSAELNGRPLLEPVLRHADLVAGGELHLVMGPRPSAWGTPGDFDAAAAAAEVTPGPPRPYRGNPKQQ